MIEVSTPYDYDIRHNYTVKLHTLLYYNQYANLPICPTRSCRVEELRCLKDEVVRSTYFISHRAIDYDCAD